MDIVVRAAVIFVFLFVVTRVLGKTTIAQLNVLELIIAIVIADLVQNAVTQQDQSLLGGMLAVSTFAILGVLLMWVQDRFPRARRLIGGQPVIVVRNGEMQREAMKLERLTEVELLQAAREAGIRDLREVELAVLEPDGKISFFTGARRW
jgi:uncharacterized membrane protein YcaP (DUF421 family)